MSGAGWTGAGLGRPAALAALAALLAAVLAPGPAGACAVCYGDPDSPMTHGANNGILTLLGVVAAVQIGFVALFVSFGRRARKLRQRREQFHLIDGGVR